MRTSRPAARSWSFQRPRTRSAATYEDDPLLTIEDQQADVKQREADEAQRLADKLQQEADALRQAAAFAMTVAVPVFLRVRAHPLAPAEKVIRVSGEEIATVTVGERPFLFDRGGGEDTSQADVFGVVGEPLCKACMTGFNSTIFCYGQTGSGKT